MRNPFPKILFTLRATEFVSPSSTLPRINFCNNRRQSPVVVLASKSEKEPWSEAKRVLMEQCSFNPDESLCPEPSSNKKKTGKHPKLGSSQLTESASKLGSSQLTESASMAVASTSLVSQLSGPKSLSSYSGIPYYRITLHLNPSPTCRKTHPQRHS
ncbi:hypothetical protein EV1_014442 [Malus domestica]